MNEKEIQESLEAIKRSGKKVTSSKEEAEAFLKRIGVLTEEGELKQFFKDEDCTPRTQPARA